MKTIKAVRASGLPIRDIDNYTQEYRLMYDKVLADLNVVNDRFLTDEESSKVTSVIESKEKELQKQYPLEEQWPLMTTKKAWREAIQKFGPITVVYDKDSKSLNYVILDVPVGS